MELSQEQVTAEHLQQIWSFNASVASPMLGRVHDLVAELADRQPFALAVNAWDGDLTYAELDRLANRLAGRLSTIGVLNGSIVPMYLRKSKWSPVAMLGIMKSGAAAVALDVSYPKSRVQDILRQIDAKVILTSPDLRSELESYLHTAVELVSLTESACWRWSVLESPILNGPHDIAYITFTSGSAGSPKGAMITHSNVRSAVHYQSHLLGFHKDARVLDFAPYSFDVAWSNFMHTVCNGGCLCIARESEMYEDLRAVIASYRCTLLNITPTLLRTLQPGTSFLETILLSGEMPFAENIVQWAGRVRLLNTYGPSECTFKSAFSQLAPQETERPSVGVGVGMVTWLVDPNDHSMLVPVGSEGELLLEGPLVGQGYLKDAERTDASFIVNPPWLLAGHAEHKGREGRLYKTGDKFKYTVDGRLVFMGRKDSKQLKIRGQKVEILDVEYHARQLLPRDIFFVVDLIQPQNSDSAFLVLFVETDGHARDHLESAIGLVAKGLPDKIPAFMVPSIYIPIGKLPIGPTGKTDRRAIRETTSQKDFQELLEAQATVLSRSGPTGTADTVEEQLLSICEKILGLGNFIRPSDNFLRLGGDSLKAIRIISAAREQGIGLAFGNVFTSPSLRDLSRTAITLNIAPAGLTDAESIEPFSLLDQDINLEAVRRKAADACSVEGAHIEDILPATPMQQGLMAMTSLDCNKNVFSSSHELPSNVDLKRFRLAWQKLVCETPILRTMIVNLPQIGLVQVVVRHPECLPNFLDSWTRHEGPMGLGTPLSKLSLTLNRNGSSEALLQLHHAIFDGWSRSLILRAVQQAYDQDSEPQRLAPFQPFVKHVLQQISHPNVRTFWQEQLSESGHTPFPAKPQTSGPKLDLQYEIKDLTWASSSTTISSTLHAAIALLLGMYTNSEDVIFGSIVSGRQTPIPSIEYMAGPTLATVPIRVKLDMSSPVEVLQQRMHHQIAEIHGHEQFGLQNIQRAIDGSYPEEDGLFQLLLIVQHKIDEMVPANGLFKYVTDQRSGFESLGVFNPYSMAIVCRIGDSNMTLDVNFDSNSLSKLECERFLGQLEHIVRLMCSEQHRAMQLRELPISTWDYRQICEWNSHIVPQSNKSVLEMIEAQISGKAHDHAIESWDQCLTFIQLWEFTNRLAANLVFLEVSRGDVVLICLEKSFWMPVSMLAVMRVGAIAVPLAASASSERLRTIVDICKPTLLITLRTLQATVTFPGLVSVLTVDSMPDVDSGYYSKSLDQAARCQALSDPAVIVFTSGTTGTPKGIVWSGLALASNIIAAVEAFDLDSNSRVFQFAGYDFDVATVESLAVLSAGGCLCIPSESGCVDDLAGTIDHVKANWICLTPSVAAIINPAGVLSLKTLVFAGEQLKRSVASPWIQAGTTVINWYGPAEASVATFCKLTDLDWSAGTIGRSLSSRAWIVNPYNRDTLAPIGTIGELVIESPIVADGYIGLESGGSKDTAFCGAAASLTTSHRVFSTGDFSKYAHDGSIILLGRDAGSWVKLHGKRVQLEAIEEAAQSFMGSEWNQNLAAEVITLQGTETECLVLFVPSSSSEPDHRTNSEDQLVRQRSELPFQVDELMEYLANHLPRYMLPNYIVPLAAIPIGHTGKVDRMRIRRLGNCLQGSQLFNMREMPASEEPSSTNEMLLRRLWSSILPVPSNIIYANSHFFRLGADSITAMRLSSLTRGEGLVLTTKQIFEHPILRDMAAVATVATTKFKAVLAPFSLLVPQISKNKACAAVARACNVGIGAVVDIYPCTPMQSGLLAMTARTPGLYTSRSVLPLQRTIDTTRLKEAWLATVTDLQILRTRIVDLQPMGLVQVVIDQLPLKHSTDLFAYVLEDGNQPMTLGTELCRAAIIDRAFVLTIHHSIYDGHLLSMILRKLESKYLGQDDVSTTPFEHFVEHISQISVEQRRDFWQKRLERADWKHFPSLPTATYTPKANKQIERYIELEWPREENTPSTIIQSAFSLLAARFSASTDVMFGVVVSGRDVDMLGIEDCAGPTVCTVPFAVHLDLQETAADFKSRILRQNLEQLPYATHALESVASSLRHKYPQGLFQTLVVVQPVQQGRTLDAESMLFKPRSFSSTLGSQDNDPFNANALMLSCWLAPSGLRMSMSFDDCVLSSGQIETLMSHFETVLRQMRDPGDRKLSDIEVASRDDLAAFWEQSAKLQAKARLATVNYNDSGCATPNTEDLAHTDDVLRSVTHHPESFDTGPPHQTCRSEYWRSKRQAAIVCGVAENDVEDLYRCTPLQESLIVSTVQSPGKYVGHDVFQVPANIELARFRLAWDAVIHAAPILRTRIIDLTAMGLTQVVVRGTSWSDARSLDQYHLQNSQDPVSLGKPLVRYGLVNDDASGDNLFVLTMHHAAYDAVSQSLIREALELGPDAVMLQPFKAFLDCISQHDIESQLSFWTAQLDKIEATQFPTLPSEGYRPTADASRSVVVPKIAKRKDDIVAPTILRAAWAIVCARYTDSTDVVFGAIVSGRQAPIDGIDRIAGPTIAAVPVRVKLNPASTVSALLQSVQLQAIEMIPYEQSGLTRIAKINEDARRACQFQSMVVIQPEYARKDDSGRRFGLKPRKASPANTYQSFNSHTLLVVCTLGVEDLRLDFSFDTAVVSQEQMVFLAAHFSKLISELSHADSHKLLLDIDITTSRDLEQIRAWNNQAVCEEEEIPVHELISKLAASQPASLAISAWDGNLTYGDIDRISDLIARRLLEARVEPNQVVPICFEKSKWTAAVYFGILKAGAAVLMLDPSLPIERLGIMIQQTRGTLMISSRKNRSFCEGLTSAVAVLVVDAEMTESIEDFSSDESPVFPQVKASDLLCVVFTSGSTGTPKGCMLSHSNVSTALLRQKESHGIRKNSRMYDFSSYSFDASHWALLHCLAAGGVLCVPSEEQRRSSLADSLCHFAATDVMLTPSVARTLQPGQIPTLRRLYLGGEKVCHADLARWVPKVTCFVVYGPAECTVLATSWRASESLPNQISIGKGSAQATWVVDAWNDRRLAPVGTVGELFLQGPLVGLGYINDKVNTMRSFGECPAWLWSGRQQGSKESRRVYKTGDMVRYTSDGSILFVGRRDAQTKIHGQRLELEEVESHVRHVFAGWKTDCKVAVEVVVPQATGRSSLVAFLQSTNCQWIALQDRLNEMTSSLVGQLPSYAIPHAYIPIEALPLNASGKLDRKALKRIGESLRLDQLAGNTDLTDIVPPTTELEVRLQQLWADVLSVPLRVIGTESNFFKATGDSISAMQLASLAQAQGYTLTVSDILGNPRLADMAKMMRETTVNGAPKIFTEPFSLLESPGSIDRVRTEVSHLCQVAMGDIEDVYPCTALQTSLIAASAKQDGGFVADLWLELVEDVDFERLRQVWDEVSRTVAPILRNRLIALPGEGIVQAQLAEPLAWTQYSSPALFQQAASRQSTELGSPMTRLAVVVDPSNKRSYCVLSQHHAVYDGASVRLLLNEVSHRYAGGRPRKRGAPSFQNFIHYKLSRNQEKQRQFWARQFFKCEAVPFPTLPNDIHQVRADSTVSRQLTELSWPDVQATKSTVLRAVWSILSSKHTDSDDTVFGILSTGRQVPVADIENMIAPTISALPLRVKVDPGMTVQKLLLKLQRQAVELLPWEQSGLSDIRQASEDAALGARFNSLLVIQHHGQDIDFAFPGGPFASSAFGHSTVKDAESRSLNSFNPHALMIMCQLRKDGTLTVELNFDSSILDSLQAELLLGHFEQILRSLASSLHQRVQDINPMSEQDLQLIWDWNSSLPLANNACVHDMIAETTTSQLSHEAICAWDGSFTYQELWDLSDRLAHRLVAMGISRGSVVPLFFEKSRWMSIASLAVMKAGAACLSLDVTQPPGRLRTVIAEVAPRFSLASSENEQMAKTVSGSQVVVVDGDLLIEQKSDSCITVGLPKVDPKDVLYLVATSGSTGTPKLIVTLHENFASAAMHQSEALGVRRGMRVFDFVSYSFDVAWSNLLNTLISGACLCISSEAQRKDNIADAFNQLRADYAYFTPSVARSLDPFSMPGLKILAMGGEAISAAEVARWRHLDAVIGIYGPAECAQALCITSLGGGKKSNIVGRSFGARTWLVRPDHPEVLAPVGMVGELMIEGPTVAHGYWKNQKLTDSVFLQTTPAWLFRRGAGRPGRSGRLYKTGDMLRYSSDGSLHFVGRKDQLVKLRGQRIELNEVEHHVQRRLADYPTLCNGIAAEIVQPSNSKAPILVVFIGVVRKEGQDGPTDQLARLSRIVDDLEDDLRDVLPPYMLPSGYFPLDELPITTTNKINRRALRELGAKLILEDLGKLQLRGISRQVPTTDIERSLQKLWSSVLGIDPTSIKSQSSFLRIGGESISAMRLVATAREAGLSFSVADIFRNPRLCDLAQVVKQVESKQTSPAIQPRKPFSLLAIAQDDLMGYLQNVVEPLLVDVEAEDIQDIFPATDFQETAVLEALQDPPGRFPHWILDLPENVDFARLRWACKRLLEHFDVLRSVFVKLDDGKVWQVQASHLKPLFHIVNANDANGEGVEDTVHAACKSDVQRPRRLGQSFVGFIVIKDPAQKNHKLVFRLSHAQFDGFSFGAVLSGLSALYLGGSPQVTGASFGDYINYSDQRRNNSVRHWRRRLQGSSFPYWSGVDAVKSSSESTQDRLSIVRHANFASRGLRGLPAATIFHAACAIVLSREAGQDDVIFGRLVTGRSMLPSSLQDVVGPTLVEVPVRYRQSSPGGDDDDIWTVARVLHSQFIDDASYEAAGMREIIGQATSWQANEVDSFGWRTAFQQEEAGVFSFLGQEKAKVAVFERDHLPRGRPEIYATPSEGRLELRFEGSSKISSKDVAVRVLAGIVEVLERCSDDHL